MDDCITLEYNVMTLPTAQHKAGLAGLVLSIQEMSEGDRKRGNNGLADEDIPIINSLTATTVSITLTENSCQKLFDDCYHAVIGTVEVEKPWKNADTLSTFEREKKDEKTNKVKMVTMHVHPNLEPRNPFLARHLFKDLKESKKDLWYKLWREMLFKVPRAIPATRNPYKQTVEGSCKAGADMWKSLCQFEKSKEKNEIKAIGLSSSLLLGAQDSTAENVDFKERVDNILALNFWPLTTLIYVPFLLVLDSANPARSKMEDVGYSLAIPDISNLEMFCSRFTGVLNNFRETAKPQGYRPKNACIEIAAESSLDLLTQQAWLAGEKTKKLQLPKILHAVEYIHLHKAGNNVKTLGSGRVSTDPKLLLRYTQIRDRYRSPLFRSIRLGALLDRQPRRWWEAFEKPLNTLPHELLMSGPSLPYLARFFCTDIRTAFREELSPSNQIEKGNDMAKETLSAPEAGTDAERKPKSIEQIVLNMVRTYVIAKTESKTGVEYSTVKSEIGSQKTNEADGEKKANSPQKSKFEEARRKLAERLFLEVRSRHGRDFAAYFAEHFGASKQYTIAASSDFQKICDCLLKTPQDVRVVTLLALSATS